jgi:hypothetical protein
MQFRLVSVSLLLTALFSGSGCASMSGWGNDCCYDGCVDAGCGRPANSWSGGGWGSMLGGSRRCCPTMCDPCDPCASGNWALPTYDGVATSGMMTGGCANCQQGQNMVPGAVIPGATYPAGAIPGGTTFEQGTWSNEQPMLTTPGGASMPIGPTPAAAPATGAPVTPATPMPNAPASAVTPTAYGPATYAPAVFTP